MKRSLILILLLFIANLSLSQITQVRGVVIDSITGSPLPYVKVKSINGTAGTLTDTSGHYTLLLKNAATDTIEFSSVGYISQRITVTPEIPNEVNIFLVPNVKSFDVVEIIAGENPAFEILRKVKEHKKYNDPYQLEAYECEVYNKMQFDVNKLGDNFEERKAFNKMKVVNDYVDYDSTVGAKYIPILLTESISDYYFKSAPVQIKEEIKANRITGVDYMQLEKFTGDMHQNVNVYDNYIELFNKEFMSPIADGGKLFYKYYLQDNDTIDGVVCYHLKFVPKRKGDAVFDGDIWIADSSYAVKQIIADIPNNVNLNYVSDLHVEQYYSEVEPGVWMLVDEQMKGYFDLFNDFKKKKLLGATVHKHTSRKDFVINQPKDFNFYVADVVLSDSAKVQDESYWEEHRHNELSQEEQGVIEMVDSLKNNKRFKFYENLTYMAYTGFWRTGPIEIGSIYSLYNKNTVEGHRLMLALRTSNKFSTKVEINAFGIYGFGDQDFKYGGSLRWKIRNAPREMFRIGYRRRIEQLGLAPSIGEIGNSFTTLFSLGPLDKLTMVEKGSVSLEKDWRFDMRTFHSVEWKKFTPLGTSDYSRIDLSTGDTNKISNITSFEVRNQIMFTKEEKFLNGQFDRVSLGSKYPIISLTHTWGIKDVIGSEYDFHRLDFVYDHRPRVGMFGRIQYSIYAGKVFGQVPYPFLNIHPGNQTLYLQLTTFNLMRYYEFISDEWVGINFEHRLQGFIMDRIPLIKKAKLRLVYNAKMIVGRYNNKHNEELLLPTYSYRLQYPYYEVGAGIENIFKFIRVDAVWRLSYRDHIDSNGNQVRNFGVFFTFKTDF
ncbi:DUF5686 and carboxypeptidase regulatory-like domain-containing protein [Paracrocinitomix mangrovi]|uniref:DUF5686 and carboxypeptidase-like regulatory domain-containing protein n=1 Tax=Paracrocinitomix mangrovi TaxID=2862509 RepID=UPI001C8EC960|nr:DUF5686 and carboxypeptidase-like regulatory domain-containing protein [Paracrocinitomix mangrovi]UKN01532.1 DUF5686 and carboxypeptidase regulatory-like domain-containing protein [Paracrocinitomix mangrovi]